MKENRQALDEIKELLKRRLPDYLTQMGYVTTRQFKCINPEHNDSHPSCGLVPQSDNQVFHCFSCNVVGDIFTAANFLEGKPVNGRGFIQENLMYLAHRFGEDVPNMPDMSDEDLFELEVESAYLHAAMIIKSAEQSDRVKSRVAELGWTRDVMMRIGIGSVANYNDFIQRLVKHYRHDLEFLKKVDLANPRIFHENNLIYTIRDEHGAPVGFQARDLNYAAKKAQYDTDMASIQALPGTEAEKDALLEKLFKPTKFTNTSDKCPIYNKGSRLFNIDQARKYAPPLYVFEGNSDVTTAAAGGLQNTVAICSTYFTRDHLELVLSCGIKHLIFCLDADAAGDKGVNKFIQLLEECMAGHIGLRVDIIVMPEGTDDPDAYIRSFGDLRRGVQEFRRLPTMDIFSWTMRRRVKEGADPMSLAQETVPMIVNEINNLIRMNMTKKLAQETGLDESGLWREVLRLVDIDRMGLEEEKALIAKAIAKDLQKNPSHAHVILERGRIQIETLEKRKSGYDPRSVINAIQHQFDRAEKINSPIELVTGFAAFDRAFGGVPFADTFMSFPGKPSHAKTTFLQNLAWRLVEHNPGCRVLFHTMDDALSLAQPRLMATKFQLPTCYFQKAGFYRNQIDGFDQVYNRARTWLSSLVETERLILADVAILAPALASLEVWVRNLRNKFPEDPLVVIGDNFAQYDLPGFEGERLDREKSKMVKRIANEYHVSILMTVELPKGALQPGRRPRMANIKGTSGIAYDINANVGVYNDLKDMREKAVLTWERFGHEISPGPMQSEQFPNQIMPIIELVIDKSKISSFDGNIYYRLDPDSGHMDECSEQEQLEYKEKAAKAADPNGDHSPYQRTQNAF